jgi:hypothetical protein
MADTVGSPLKGLTTQLVDGLDTQGVHNTINAIDAPQDQSILLYVETSFPIPSQFYNAAQSL